MSTASLNNLHISMDVFSSMLIFSAQNVFLQILHFVQKQGVKTGYNAVFSREKLKGVVSAGVWLSFALW
ncbi:MAG: hypothetical protein IIX72_05375, partial [Oscillospiraceae bacterium]|nr:hypothetical protein [Oscillospiraceae bacterium]